MTESALADKCAEKVAKNPLLEDLVKRNFENNPKFSFLKGKDPFRPYFDFRVQELVMKYSKGVCGMNLILPELEAG